MHRVMVLVLTCGIACAPSEDQDTAPPALQPAPSVLLPQPGHQPGAEVRFADVTAASGLDFAHVSGDTGQRFILETMSGGAAFFDYDADGYLDLYLVNGTRVEEEAPTAISRLYRNVPGSSGQRLFTDVTARAGVGGSGWGMGCAAADHDNDGDVDLYVTYWGPNLLYRNDGDGGFTDVTARSGVGDDGWGASAAFGDLDADGRLDLYVANYLEFDLEAPPNDGEPCLAYRGIEGACGPIGLTSQADLLYRNGGGGVFEDVSAATGVAGKALAGLGVAFCDYDDDGDQDIYVANDQQANLLWRNDSDWQLREVGAISGVAYNADGKAQAGMGVDFGDYDGDGDQDFYVTNFSADVNTLYRNDGKGMFADATAAAGLDGPVRPFVGWSTAFLDADNDGWQDLFVANGHLYPQLEIQSTTLRYRQRNLLYWNHRGRFAPAADAGSGLDVEKVSRGAAFGDYDNDGDRDIAVVNLNDAPTLLRNDGGNRNNWLGLELEGTSSNRDGIGARVLLSAGGRTRTREVRRCYGYQSAHDHRLLFGLGSREEVDRVEILWPSGRVQVLEKPESGRYLKLREGEDEPVASYAVATALPAAVPGQTKSPAGEKMADPAGDETPGLAALPAQATAREIYLMGVERHEEVRHEEAERLFREVIKREPHHMEAYYSLAVTLFKRLGRIRKAARVLEEAVSKDSTRAPIFHLLGAVRLSLDQPERAVAALEKAAALAPRAWEIRNRLGLAYLRTGSRRSAINAFQAAAGLAPWAPTPHEHLARLYEALDQPQAARREQQLFARLRPVQDRINRFRKVLRVTPDDAELQFRVGREYLLQGRGAEAAAAFERAVALKPEFAKAHYALAGALHGQGKLDRAIAEYGRAYAADAGLVTALNDMGLAQHQAGRLARAIATFERVVRLRPDLARAHLNLGMAYAEQGRREEAVAALQKAVQEDSTLELARRALGRLQERE